MLAFSCEKTLQPVGETNPEEQLWRQVPLTPPVFIDNFQINRHNHLYLSGSFDGNSGIFISEDAGKSWFHSYNIVSPQILSINPFTDDIYYGAYAGFYGWVKISTDYGNTWQIADSFPTNPFVTAIEFLPNNTTIIGSAFSDESGGGIFISHNSGIDWLDTGISHYTQIRAMTTVGDSIILASASFYENNAFRRQFYSSTDSGQNWDIREFDQIDISIIHMATTQDGNVIAGTIEKGLHISSDLGENWQLFALENTAINAIEIDSENNIVTAVTKSYAPIESSVYIISSGNNQIYDISDNLPAVEKIILKLDSANYLYCGTRESGLFKSRFPMPELIQRLQSETKN